MRAAADLEDRNEKHIVTPGRIVPARELLGEMLLELKQPEAALNEFEASQQREPNRFRNYLGAARAAKWRAIGRKPPRTTTSSWRSQRMPTRRGPSSRARRSLRSGEQARRTDSRESFPGGDRGLAPVAAADPNEADPDLAARDEDYAAGKRAAEKQDWAEAARFFQRAEIRHPDHADLQNSLGFSYRNLKQFELAFKHYRRAIELDPRHRGAHEYIGEAYLMIGDLPGAERHLAALKEICLLPCDELKDLERAIVEYRSRK